MNKGYTLIELIIVLTLMATIMALVAPAFTTTFANLKLKTTAREMASLLNYARSLAIFQQKNFKVLLDLDNNTFGLESGSYKKLPKSVRIEKVSSRNGEQKEGTAEITFFFNGSSSEAHIHLMDVDEKKGFEIIVDPILGRARVKLSEK